MKIANSLKTLRSRDKDCKLVRRKGRVYVIKRNGGGNVVNILTSLFSGQTIDETSTSYVISVLYEVVRLQSDGSNWWKI